MSRAHVRDNFATRSLPGLLMGRSKLGPAVAEYLATPHLFVSALDISIFCPRIAFPACQFNHFFLHCYNTTATTMSKKSKRGKRGKAKPVVPSPSRKTAFIASENGSERVFPREIRNKIYRLLLTGDSVQVHPRGNPQEIRVHRYRFRVNILRANKAINAEAKEILFKENDFIIVSAKEQYFETNMEAFAVPIVTKNKAHLTSFTEHVLEFRFTNEHETGASRRCYCKECLRPAKETKHLLLARDLDVFVRFCRTMNHLYDSGNFAIVDSPRDQPFRSFRQGGKSATTAITVRKTEHTVPSPAFVANVAEKLQKVIGARKVKISGAIDASLALDTQRAMMPKVVFGYAMGWDLVELMTSWKQYADEVSNPQQEGPAQDHISASIFNGSFV